MKIISSIIAALSLLATGTYAYLPGPQDHAIVPRFPCGGSGCTPAQTEQAIQNASMLLGWQLVGVMQSNQQIHDACRDIQTISHGKWSQVGLDGFAVEGVLCHYLAAQIVDNTTTLDLAAVNASITTYATNLFLTQLLHAFSPPGQPGNLTEPPSPDPSNNITNAIFTFMCGNLNCEIIDALQLDGPRIIEQVCAVVGLPPSNNTASTQDRKGASNATVDRYLYRRSALFGTLIALTARSQAEANAFCNSTSNATIALAPERFSALGMLPDEVNATLCGYPDGIFDPPPSLWGPQVSDDAQWRTRQVNNEMFATVVEVVVRDDGWTEFLCEWMDAEGLGSTGVDGETVIQIMCKDTRMGPPPKSRMRKRGIGM